MLCGLLSRIRSARILVIGDFMLDAYTRGRIERISPEAPVPVLHACTETSQPGGAGNVALNVRALGAEVIACGRVGNDRHGKQLLQELERDGIDTGLVLVQEGYITPVKNRILAEAQQVLRVDIEAAMPIAQALENRVLDALETLVNDVDLVAISDYGKGFLSPLLLQRVIAAARAHGRMVVVDPKGDDFAKYAHATLLKPNVREAYAAAQLPLETSLDRVAEALLAHCQVGQLCITRAEEGMSLFQAGKGRLDFPVLSREVVDVTGAGDTVLAMISLAMANGLEITQAAQLANTAASIAIERTGCARVTLADLAARLLQTSTDNKIFDEEHLFALRHVLHGKRYTLLSLCSEEGITTALFRGVRQLAEKGDLLIAYIRDPHPDPEYIAFLSSLREVQFILLKGTNLKNLLAIIRPQSFFVMQGGDLIMQRQDSKQCFVL